MIFFQKSPQFTIPLFVLGVLFIGACSAPGNESWPTVSFGEDVEKTNATFATPPGVQLAPLPTLLSEDLEGVENKRAFLGKIEANFREVLANLETRFQDYAEARNNLTGIQNEAFTDAWLTAQMEISNISQYTEDLVKMRAQVNAIEAPAPEQAAILKERLEARELENRLFLRNEKTRLQQLMPQNTVTLGEG